MSETTTTNQPAVKSFKVACSKCNRIGKARGADRREAARALWRDGWRNEGKAILCPDCMKAGIVTIPHNADIHVPPSVAVCPICGATIIVEIDEWSQLDDGSWVASNVHPDCITAPAIDSKEWSGWFHQHWDMPYVHWLPLQKQIKSWINDHYRFDMEKEA